MTRVSASRGAFSAIAFLTFVLPAAPALAQAASQPAATNENGPPIEEVIVTATRRSEALNKVPESISAFTTERMDTLGVKSIADIVRFTPGVNFDPESKDISIRGVNSTAGDATTGIYIDDTPIQLRTLGFGSDNTLPSVFDLDRVEVLRGPQGTLFGAGSEGGTVRYITPQPSLTDYQVYAKGEVSDTDSGAPSYEAGLAIGGPIADGKLGFRISGWGRRDGGWIDKVDYTTGDLLQSNTNSVDTYVVRGAVLWQPIETLTITPSVYYQNRDQNNLDDYWVGLSNLSQGVYKTATPENMGDKDHFTLSSLKVDYDVGGIELISNTSYFDRREVVQDYSGTLYNLSYFQRYLDPSQPGGPTDPQGTPCPNWPTPCAYRSDIFPLLTADNLNLPGFGHYESTNYVTNTQNNFTQELRMQSTDSDAPLTWIFGVFYTNQSQLSVEEINDPQLPALTQYLWGEDMLTAWGEDLLPNGDDYINHTRGHENQFAVFGNATYAITDTLKLQVGARLARTHFDFANYSDGPQNYGPLPVNIGRKDEKPFTPMAGLTWQVTDDDMLYATAAKGYRIGGANPHFPVSECSEITTEPSSYDSDSVTSYEAGSKDKLFGGRLEASGSVYYLKWNNIQQIVDLPSCGFRYTTNQGAAVSKGFDLQGEWLATDNLNLDFSAGFTDAYYTSTSQSAGLILARPGNKLPGSPWTFSLGAQYNIKVMGQDSFLRADYEYAGRETGLTPERDNLTTLYDGGALPEPATSVISLRAGTTFGNTNIELFADNLLDSHPQLNRTHQDELTLLYEASTLRPRTIGLTATYRY
jgi:outer membrane receptor protein involved in Fe transport